jgi:uncharacterized protein (DUF169 family)
MTKRHKESKMSMQLNELAVKIHHSTKLQKTLELDGSPVAVAITPKPPEGLKQWQYKATPCVMIQIARLGSVFYSSVNNILCGGRSNLGIAKPILQNLDDFLVRREKLFGSKVAARRLLDSVKERAPKLGEYLTFSPLEKATFDPDVILFVGTPLQISRIVFLDSFETGEIDVVHGEPLCSGALATPITTGKIGVSFLDMSCRSFGRYKPEEMVIGVPYPKMSRIVKSIDLSIAGTANPGFLLKTVGNLFRRHVPSRLK